MSEFLRSRDLDSIEPTSGAAVDAAVQQRLRVLQMRDGGAQQQQQPNGSSTEPDWPRALADAITAEREAEARGQQSADGSSAHAAAGVPGEDVDERGWLPK